MTEHEPQVHARPSDPAESIPNPPFEVEDRTDPAFKALITEVLFMRKWVESERDAGRQPN